MSRKRKSFPPKDTRITVSAREDRTEYDRQRKYIENHPDCESVPPKRGPQPNDTRYTVSYREDPTEYNRQWMYIKSHPDCESVPPKQR